MTWSSLIFSQRTCTCWHSAHPPPRKNVMPRCNKFESSNKHAFMHDFGNSKNSISINALQSILSIHHYISDWSRTRSVAQSNDAFVTSSRTMGVSNPGRLIVSLYILSRVWSFDMLRTCPHWIVEKTDTVDPLSIVTLSIVTLYKSQSIITTPASLHSTTYRISPVYTYLGL
jgi:hypothetical protein